MCSMNETFGPLQVNELIDGCGCEEGYCSRTEVCN